MVVLQTHVRYQSSYRLRVAHRCLRRNTGHLWNTVDSRGRNPGVTTNLTYKWYRSDDANYDEGTDTLRTTGTSYTPVAEDIGKYLIVVVTTPDASGSGIVATLATVGTEITDYTRFPNVTLDADEHITDLEALRASGKLPITVTVTDGTHSVEANIGNWYNIAELDEFDGTTPGTYTLRATWHRRSGGPR